MDREVFVCVREGLASLKIGRQVREQASKVDRRVGVKYKSMWGNLQAMTEKGENVKNYQTNKGLLESKLSKNILGDCTFINSMQKIPLILNVCQTIQSATLQHPVPVPMPLLLKSDLFFFFLSQPSINKTHI